MTKTIINEGTSVFLDKVSKSYQINNLKKKKFSLNLLNRSSRKKIFAIKKVSLSIKKGERIGFIGLNGSGKTTLLKIISGISIPDCGEIKTFGKIASLINLEAGLQSELSGRENILLNGMLGGMNKNAVIDKFEQIVRFIDMGNYIDYPVYMYSQGMKLRLGFSVAVHSNPDILILDEGMSVGDINFIKKGTTKIKEFFKHKKTVLMVSHSLEFLKKNCQRIIWLENGAVFKDGGLNLLKEYRKFNNNEL